jgi:hypothetical protein
MKSLSILLFPMYFRYFKKSKFSTFISFRRRNKRRSPSMRRNNDYKIFETKLGGKVYFDIDNKMPKIERSHPDNLMGEPKCDCCPPAMSGHRLAIVGNYAYVYGGLCEKRDEDGFHISTDLWRLRLIDNTWKRIPLKDEAFYFAPVSYAWIATKKWGLLTFGGTGFPFGVTINDKLCRLYIKNTKDGCEYNVVPLQSYGSSPLATYGGALIADEEHDCIYYVGGTNGHEYYSDVYRGDFLPFGETSKVYWTLLTSHCFGVAGRYRHEIVLHNNKILIFGGGNADTLYSVNSITYFDLEENNFGVLNTSPDPVHKFPPKRDCFSLIRYDDLVFLMGGRATPDGRTLLDDIWCLDLSTFIWHKNSMKLSFRTAFQASAVDDNGRVYVFGGHRGSSSSQPLHIGRTNMIQSFIASPPSLKSICQRFIAQRYKKGISLSDKAVYSPEMFVKEILPHYNAIKVK